MAYPLPPFPGATGRTRRTTGALSAEQIAQRLQSNIQPPQGEAMQAEIPLPPYPQIPQIPAPPARNVGNLIINRPTYGKSTANLVPANSTLKGVPIDYRNGATFQAHEITKNAWTQFWKSTEGKERSRLHANLLYSYAERNDGIIRNGPDGYKTKAEIRRQWMDSRGERVTVRRGQ